MIDRFGSRRDLLGLNRRGLQCRCKAHASPVELGCLARNPGSGIIGMNPRKEGLPWSRPSPSSVRPGWATPQHRGGFLMQTTTTRPLVRLGESDRKLAKLDEDIRHRKIVDSNSDEIGKVDDLFVDPQTGQVRFLLARQGGAPGHREEAVPDPGRRDPTAGEGPGDPQRDGTPDGGRAAVRRERRRARLGGRVPVLGLPAVLDDGLQLSRLSQLRSSAPADRLPQPNRSSG